MRVYVVTHNIYLRYEIDSTSVSGVFSSKANAELYIEQHKHEIFKDSHYDHEYFEVIEYELDGGLI